MVRGGTIRANAIIAIERCGYKDVDGERYVIVAVLNTKFCAEPLPSAVFIQDITVLRNDCGTIGSPRYISSEAEGVVAAGLWHEAVRTMHKADPIRTSGACSESHTTLSTGVCQSLHTTLWTDDPAFSTPQTVQILATKLVPFAPEPYRRFTPYEQATISDGVHYFQARLSTELNEMVCSGAIRKNTIISVDRMVCEILSSEHRYARNLIVPPGLPPNAFELECRFITIKALSIIRDEKERIGQPLPLGMMEDLRNNTPDFDLEFDRLCAPIQPTPISSVKLRDCAMVLPADISRLKGFVEDVDRQ
ncbi:hypothetical protein NMY22_g14942 [Coprinellus aureogranulatus]|nr:hypothetical protein NMY22_g14942 [Coprinellus aureogranulatus]